CQGEGRSRTAPRVQGNNICMDQSTKTVIVERTAKNLSEIWVGQPAGQKQVQIGSQIRRGKPEPAPNLLIVCLTLHAEQIENAIVIWVQSLAAEWPSGIG